MSIEQFGGGDRHRRQSPDEPTDRLNLLVLFEPPPLSNNRDVGARESTNNFNVVRTADWRVDPAVASLPNADRLLDGLKDAAPRDSRMNTNTPVSDRIHQLIHGTGNVTSLGSAEGGPGVPYRNRQRAERELIQLGTTALPQLLLAHDDTDDLQVLRGSQSTIRDIMRNLSDMQLLELRDQQFRDRMFNSSLGRPPSREEATRLNTALDSQITNALSTRLITPEWLRATQIYSDFKQPARSLPSEEAVRQFDRLATPEGRRQVTERLTQLNAIFSSDRLTTDERELIAQQIRELNQVMSPAFVADGQINARVAFATFRHSVAPVQDEAIVQRNLLEAARLSGERQRGGVVKTILEIGLDQNQAFMQQLARHLPAAQIQEIRDRRQLMIRMQAEGLREIGDK